MTTTTEAPERVLKARDVADHLGCTPDTVYLLIRKGELRSIRVGRLVRIPESALAEFVRGGGGATDRHRRR